MNNFPYDHLSERELAALIVDRNPFPLHQRSHPPMVRNPKSPAYAPALDILAHPVEKMRRSMEREVFTGIPEYVDAPPNEWSQYKHLTEYIGGFTDECRWKRDHVRMLSRDAKLTLLDKLQALRSLRKMT